VNRLLLSLIVLAVPFTAFADEEDDGAPVIAPAPPRPPRLPARGRSVIVRVPATPPTPPAPPAPPVPPTVVQVNPDDGHDHEDEVEAEDEVEREDGMEALDDLDVEIDDEWVEELTRELEKLPHVNREELRRLVEQAREQAREGMRHARQQMRHALEETRRARHQHRHANAETERAREQAERAREQAERTREQVREHVERARERAEEARERAREQVERARERMRERRQCKDEDCEGFDVDFDLDADLDFDFEGAGATPPRPPRPPRPPLAPRPAMAPRPPQPPGPPPPQGSTALKVGGPVSFHLEMTQGGVEVASGGDEVAISGPGCAPGNVQFDRSGEEVEAELEVGGCRGPLKVRLPAGSRVNVSTIDGDIVLRGSFGDVELEAVSGHINVDRAANAEISTVGGNLTLRDATGRVRAETVSGNATISMSGSSPRMVFESTSGNLSWSGLCASGCRLQTELFSGTADLKLDPRSSFSFKYASRNGDLRDELGIRTSDTKKHHVRGTFGGGEGVVGVETFSGSVKLSRR
jgi:hypothetical protein